MEEENKKEEGISEETDNKEKKIKNLISLSILLGGLLLGSIFVDVIQLIRGGGFSSKKLAQTDIFNYGGKTWVSYSEPIVKVQVISDDSCEACKPDEPVLWLHRIAPTIMTSKLDQKTEEGDAAIKKFGIKTLPAFVFSKEIENTDFFKQAGMLFVQKDNNYVLKTSELGIQPGKYIETMQAKDNDIKIGNSESKVTIFEFSDFQCPYCKAFHTSVTKKIISEFGDKVLLVYKNFPLNFHPQAENAALASECANEQGKFVAYADKLFTNQDDWGKSEGTQKFKLYAQQIGLKSDFNSCLDDKKYIDKVNVDKGDAESFGISGTPSIFINDKSVSSGTSYEEIKKMIEAELAK